jgi:RHS repeat-associated protein
MTVSGQAQIVYGYDNGNRLTSITQNASVVSMGYDAASRRTLLTLPNEVTVEATYDPASRVSAIAYRNASGTLGDLTYTYDAAWSRVAMGGTWARTGLPQALVSATYDAANQILTFGGAPYAYDANGNLTSNGATSYSWNARDQLTAVNGTTNASMDYDALGRRRARTTGGAAITSFLYDGPNIVQELTDGVPTVNLITGSVDETFTRTDDGGTRVLLTDALGSVVALTNMNASVQTTYTYDSFGKTTSAGTPDANTSQFTGRENDMAGLYYYRARYYNPESARFLSEDPLGFGDGPNPYIYAHANPLLFVDPFGLQSWAEMGRSAWNVGPVDALTGYNISQRALADAQNSGLPGLHNGPADAFRHCLWSCRMTQALGGEQAKLIADQHEEAGARQGQRPDEAMMDYANNHAGRQCGTQPGPNGQMPNCYDSCMDLLFNGKLFGLGGKPMAPPNMIRPTPSAPRSYY